jgi:hypothetical protein
MAIDIRRINYREPENYICCRLALLGFSTRLIMRECNLTKSQILYRLRKVSIRRWDFRNGNTEIARVVIDQTQKATRRELEVRLKPLLAKWREVQNE